MPLRRQLLLGSVSLGAAAALWLPGLHWLFASSASSAASRVQKLAARQLALFEDLTTHVGEAARMRHTNAEWDFMGRTFLGYALAEMALADTAGRPRYLAALDAIIADTLRHERADGMYYFLMPYARGGEFRQQPARSLFLDGELALLLALRRLVAEREDYRPLLAERVEAMTQRMSAAPVLSAESYPDECWTFCNTVALAAIKAADVLEGTNHDALARRWVERARAQLVDPSTGLLVSSYTLDGRTRDGPEGSSLWMASHMLRAVDPAFAEDQYRRAKRELAREVLGFGYAAEWPARHRGNTDVDSGPIVPGLDVSGGSSGLAFVAASSFGDRSYLQALLATLDFAAFPVEESGRLRYCASNQVGDAVVLYALSIGPLWQAVVEGRRP
jgi:hypothetical protein